MRGLRCILSEMPKRFSDAYVAISEASELLWKSDHAATPAAPSPVPPAGG